MPLPNGYLPRKGDLLLIRVKVKHDVSEGEEDVHFSLPGREYSSHIVELTEIAALHCRAWEAGDKIVYRGNPGEVVATCGTEAWIRDYHADQMKTVSANELIPMPEPVEQVESAA